jgi:hypothetical protein
VTISANDSTSTRSACAVRIAFATSFVLGAVALAVTLSLSPVSVARVNYREDVLLDSLRSDTTACQPEEVLPRDTSALRLHMFTFTGPRVVVGVFEHGRRIAHGERGSDWTGGSVTVPVNRLASARYGATLCFALYLNGNEIVQLNGEPTANRALAARERDGYLPGRVAVEDLRPGSSSWWSLIVPVARRMGLGHAGSGTWSVLLVVGLMLGVILIATRVGLRELA